MITWQLNFLLIYYESKYLLNYFQFQIINADYGQKVGIAMLNTVATLSHTERTNKGLTTDLMWFTIM